MMQSSIVACLAPAAWRMARAMTFAATVLTLYPEMFPGPLGVSLAGRALEEGTWSLETVQIRDFATDKHRTVDDTPGGRRGGDGAEGRCARGGDRPCAARAARLPGARDDAARHADHPGARSASWRRAPA